MRCSSMQGVLVVAAAFGGSSLTASASPAAPFSLPLPQLLGSVAGSLVTPEAFESLPDTDAPLRYCSHLTPSQLALASKASVASGVVSACDSAKYVSAMKEFATATAVQTTAQSGLVARLPSVAADASSFSQLFSDYMEAGKAVELKPMQTDTTQPDLDPDSVEASVKDAITACANVVASQADLATLGGVSLEASCPEALKTLKVPFVASNDYLVRLTDGALKSATTTTTTDGTTAAAASLSRFSHSPTLTAFTSSSSSQQHHQTSDFGHGCGLGMNAAFQVVSGSVDVLLFDTRATSSSSSSSAATGQQQQQRHQEFPPHFGSDPASLHHLQYTPATGAGDWASDHFDKLSGGVTKDVGEGSVLFVPFETLVAFRPAAAAAAAAAGSSTISSGSAGSVSGSGAPPPSAAAVVKYCFVDAANLNSVKQHVQLEALSTPSSRSLAAALTSLRLDTSMNRSPAQGGLRWSDHAQWPRPEVTAVAGGKGGEGGGGSKRVRRSQKDWQADVKWKWKVVGLTLPTLSAPTVTAFGRRNATLNWLSGFRVQEGDSSEFGYNITWYLGHGSSSSSSSGDNSVVGFKQIAHADLTDKSEALDDYHVHDLSYALPDGSLAPATEYTFRVAVYYGEAVAPLSSPSKPVVTPGLSPPSRLNTAPTKKVNGLDSGSGGVNSVEVDTSVAGSAALTTSLQLWSLPPIDDGGSPVVGYVVESRHSEIGMHGEWSIVGSYPASDGGGAVEVTVDHLIPNTGYEFRLTPYNHVGVAKAAGTPSTPIFTGATTTAASAAAAGGGGGGGGGGGIIHHVLGHGSKVVTVHHITSILQQQQQGGGGGGDQGSTAGAGAGHLDHLHENAPLVAEHLKAMHDPHVFTVHGPVVTLSDVHQTVTPAARKTTTPPTPTSDGSGGSGGAAGKVADAVTAIEVWVSHWSPKTWHATAELIVADPLLADTPTLNNGKAVRQRIVMMERGGVPIVQKVLLAQQSGALGVVLTDGGECVKFDQHCSPGAEKKNGDGFAKLDMAGPWANVRIPVVMMLRDDADTLLSLFE